MTALAALVLAAEVAFLYGRTVRTPITRVSEFVMDNDEWRTIRQVRDAARAHGDWDARLRFLWREGATSPDRPLAGWSHYLTGFTLGFDAARLHLVNIAFHAGAAFLLFLFVRALSGSPLAGLAAAVAFAAYPHPQASVNRWIVRDAPQSAFFLAASLALAVARSTRAAGRALAWAASFGAYLLALGSYPVAGLVGTLAPLAPLARRDAAPGRRDLLRAAALGAPFWIAFAVQALRITRSANYATVSGAMAPGPLKAARFLLWDMPGFVFAGPGGVLVVGLVAPLAGALIASRKVRDLRAPLFGAALAALGALPVVGFYDNPDIIWHGKYTYLPALGLAALLGAALLGGGERLRGARALGALGAALWIGNWGAAAHRDNARWAERGAKIERWAATASRAAAALPEGGTVYAVPAMGDAVQLFRQRIGTFERPDLRWVLADVDLRAKPFPARLNEDVAGRGDWPAFSLDAFAAESGATLLYFRQKEEEWEALSPAEVGAWLAARGAEAEAAPAEALVAFAPGAARDADWGASGVAAPEAPYTWSAAPGRADLSFSNTALALDPARYEAVAFEARIGRSEGGPVRLVISWTQTPPGVFAPADGFAEVDLPRGGPPTRAVVPVGDLPTWSFLPEIRGLDLRLKRLGDAEFQLRDLRILPRRAPAQIDPPAR